MQPLKLQILVSLSAPHSCAHLSNTPQADFRPRIAGTMQLMVERFKDEDNDVRQALLEAIVKLASDGQFVSYSFNAHLMLLKWSAPTKLRKLGKPFLGHSQMKSGMYAKLHWTQLLG